MPTAKQPKTMVATEEVWYEVDGLWYVAHVGDDFPDHHPAVKAKPDAYQAKK